MSRPPEEDEKHLVAALKTMLNKANTSQIDAAASLLTAEGEDVLIAALPHQSLGGLSLVVWLDKRELQILWAQIWRIDCCHDDLDRGVIVAKIRRHPDMRWIEQGAEEVHRELDRQIYVAAAYEAKTDIPQPAFIDTFISHRERRPRIGRAYGPNATSTSTSIRTEHFATSLSATASLPFHFSPLIA